MRITLCGSARYMDQFHAWNKWLALHGHTVYSVATSVKGTWTPTEDEKETLDLVHLDKILNSTAVLIIDCLRMPDEWAVGVAERRTGAWEHAVAQYTGESTKRELKWAHIHRRVIMHTHNHVEQEGPL